MMRKREIEKLNRDQVFEILEAAGVKKSAGYDDDQEYEKAKNVLFGDKWLSGGHYDRLWNIMAEYLGYNETRKRG